MFRNLMIFIMGFLTIALTGCDLKTPEIRGVVLDAGTKQLVEGAWVTATLEVYSKTVGGEVHHSLLPGKSCTDKEGKFLSPSKEFKSEGGAWPEENKTPFLVKRVEFFRNDFFLKSLNSKHLKIFMLSLRNYHGFRQSNYPWDAYLQP